MKKLTTWLDRLLPLAVASFREGDLAPLVLLIRGRKPTLLEVTATVEEEPSQLLEAAREMVTESGGDGYVLCYSGELEIRGRRHLAAIAEAAAAGESAAVMVVQRVGKV
jgi:hypothetical protein